MTDPVADLLAAARFGRIPPRPGPECPSDLTLAAFVEETLPGAERLRTERHALACADCHVVLAEVLELFAARRAPAVFRVVARLLARGLELVNAAEHRLLGDGAVRVALGGVRGAGEDDALALAGPGAGLDELLVQRQPGGAVQLVVRGVPPADLAPDETASLVLEDEAGVREKRPFAGTPLSLPLEPGTFRLRLLARAPGRPSRELAAAVVELHG